MPRRLRLDAPPRLRALDVLALFRLHRREGWTITRARREAAAREASSLGRPVAPLDMRTLWRHVGSELRRIGRRLTATAGDRLPRFMLILGPQGPEPITVRGSGVASRLSAYWSAIGAWREGRDPGGAGLRAFRGLRVAGRALITDLAALRRLGQAGLLHIPSVYATR